MINAEQIKRDVIVIGASAGGVDALIRIFSGWPADGPAVVAAVLHRSAVYSVRLATVLGRHAKVSLVEPEAGAALKPGLVYLAPRDHHMELRNGHIALHRGPREHYTRPAIDPLFRSAAAGYGPRVVGVVLTGFGDDGVTGLIEIKAAGGIAVVQDPEEAKMPSMPRSALIHDHVDLILPLADIPPTLMRLAEGRPVNRGVS